MKISFVTAFVFEKLQVVSNFYRPKQTYSAALSESRQVFIFIDVITKRHIE